MIIESENIVNSPVVSVIITTYNHEKYIAKCIDSVLSQNLNVPYEIIIAEDSGVDKTKEICLHYQNKYSDKIRLLLQEENRGLILNYSDVLAMTRGKYIAQIAGDDFWCDDNKLQKQFDTLEKHPECDLCYTNGYTCNEQGQVNKTHLVNVHKETFEHHLLNAGYIAPGSWMFRLAVLDYIDLQTWYTDESLAVALDVLHHSKIICIDESMYVYRVHQDSAAAQSNPIKMWQYQQGLFQMQLYYSKKYEEPDDFIEKMKIQEYYNKCCYAIEAGDERFIEEATSYCENHGIIMKWFIASCREYAKYKNQYLQIRSSKAYRLGKMLLKPFRFLRKN